MLVLLGLTIIVLKDEIDEILEVMAIVFGLGVAGRANAIVDVFNLLSQSGWVG
jgi:hypothetical protein